MTILLHSFRWASTRALGRKYRQKDGAPQGAQYVFGVVKLCGNIRGDDFYRSYLSVKREITRMRWIDDIIMTRELGTFDLWKLMILLAFCGRNLHQRFESAGQQVPFAGTVFAVMLGFVVTRLHNKTMEYDSTTTVVRPLKLRRARYRSGFEFQPRSQQLGQAYGHMVRIIDHANCLSLPMVAIDILAFANELLCSGWRMPILREAMEKIGNCSPNLKDTKDFCDNMVVASHTLSGLNE